MQRVHRRLRQPREDRVGLRRVQQLDAGHVAKGGVQPRGHRVGMARVGQPGVVLEQPQPRRRDEAHLRRQLAGLLDPPGEVLGQRPVEEHDGLADRQAVLRAAEAEHIDAGAPGDVARMAAQRGHRIGEARAVHVHLEVAALGDRRDRAHLLDAIDRAQLGGLGQAHHLRLRVVDVVALGHQRFHRVRRELAEPRRGALGFAHQQLRAVGEELRPAAFVGLDVRHRAADHRVVALAQRGQRQRVGRRAVEDEIDVAVGLEELAQSFRDLLRPAVLAVGRLVAAGLRLHEPARGVRAHAGVVVAGEMLQGQGGVGRRHRQVSSGQVQFDSNALIGTQEQNRLRSPCTLSTRPTGLQYFVRRRLATG